MTELELVDFSVCFAVQDSVELAVLSSFVAIDQFFWFVKFLFAFIVNIICLFYTVYILQTVVFFQDTRISVLSQVLVVSNCIIFYYYLLKCYTQAM